MVAERTLIIFILLTLLLFTLIKVVVILRIFVIKVHTGAILASWLVHLRQLILIVELEET